MKIAVSGIHYPLSMMTYFLRAFDRREDVELFTVGPHTGTFIPWNGGMHLPKKYVRNVDIALPPQMIQSKVPYELISNQINFEPDLWLQIDAGWHFANRPKAKMVAHVQTDPHVLKELYKLPKSYSDVSFCMQTPYMESGEVYLPYAYDPTVHYPEPIPVEYDVCLIGLHYPQRDALLHALERRGLNILYTIGLVFDEYRQAYRKSKVAVSWSSLQDLPARVFEAFGMEVPLVTNIMPDLATFFVDGEHFLGFHDVDSAVEQVMRFIENSELRSAISGAAHRKAEAGHTWDDRVQQILEVCKLI